jgi:hypothetical protein
MVTIIPAICGFMTTKNVKSMATFAIDLVFKPCIRHELLSDSAIYLAVLYMIGQSKMNERLPDMTPNRMLPMLVYNGQKKNQQTSRTLIKLKLVGWFMVFKARYTRYKYCIQVSIQVS